MIVKTEFVRNVMKELPNNTSRRDIMIAVQSRLNQLPARERNGIVITYKDVNNAIKKNRLKNIQQHNNGTVTTSVPALPKTMPEDSYTVSEFRAARNFLNQMGDSLLRAQTLLKMVSELVSSK